ncbi:MAG: hypothetical protein H8E46_04755 [FCB group bacterium]|nr:hypothetical protein [FCB group bacterium]
MNKNITIFLIFLFLGGLLPQAASAQGNVFLSSADNSKNPNSWFRADKVKHFALSAVITYGSYYIYREEFNNTESGSYYFSGGFTISLGALKEYYDYKRPENHYAEWRDFIADAAGVSLGLILAYTIIN